MSYEKLIWTWKAKTAEWFQVHRSYVITAAHCIDESNPELLVAGDQNSAMMDSRTEQHLYIDEVFIHPDYHSSHGLVNDIAVIKLKVRDDTYQGLDSSADFSADQKSGISQRKINISQRNQLVRNLKWNWHLYSKKPTISFSWKINWNLTPWYSLSFILKNIRL